MDSGIGTGSGKTGDKSITWTREGMLREKQNFGRILLEEITGTLHRLPGDWSKKITAHLEFSGEQGPNLWEAANVIGACFNAHRLAPEIHQACVDAISKIRNFQGEWARRSLQTTTVVFGTSGWREAIGEGFTVENVFKVCRGIIAMMKSEAFLKTNGYSDFSEVQKAGILVLRDNRFLGEEFMAAAMHELAAEGIRIYDAGECPTGVGSALLTELRAAGSINFTPSHNPMEYAGIKFNPADGGPADTNLTSLIETESNIWMQGLKPFIRATTDFKSIRNPVNAASLFTAFVEKKSRVFNLDKIRQWLKENASSLTLVIDNMHGSSRGYIQSLLGLETMSILNKATAIHFKNTEEDYSFHGVKPEPNAKNQAILISELNRLKRKFNLAVALDPDADRIRFADANLDLDMNRFAAVGYATLLQRGLQGGLATSVPSSGFASEIARKRGQNVLEVSVGFKFFRRPLSEGQAIMAFEESDGISFVGHTLEKCALAGFLSALDAMVQSGKNLSELYSDLCQQYGFFYPGKGGADVKGVSVEAWQRYKGAVMKVLEGCLVKSGDILNVGSGQKPVVRTDISDGLKIVFSDRSWILLRPSGTEPKFRYYYEVVGEGALENVESLLNEYAKAAETILEQARELAGPSGTV